MGGHFSSESKRIVHAGIKSFSSLHIHVFSNRVMIISVGYCHVKAFVIKEYRSRRYSNIMNTDCGKRGAERSGTPPGEGRHRGGNLRSQGYSLMFLQTCQPIDLTPR